MHQCKHNNTQSPESISSLITIGWIERWRLVTRNFWMKIMICRRIVWYCRTFTIRQVLFQSDNRVDGIQSREQSKEEKKTLQNNSCDDSSNNKITNIRANSCRYFKFINTVDRWTTTVATTNTYQFVFSNRTTLQSFKAGCCYCSHWRLEYFTHYTRAYMRYDSQNLIFLYIFCQ